MEDDGSTTQVQSRKTLAKAIYRRASELLLGPLPPPQPQRRRLPSTQAAQGQPPPAGG